MVTFVAYGNLYILWVQEVSITFSVLCRINVMVIRKLEEYIKI